MLPGEAGGMAPIFIQAELLTLSITSFPRDEGRAQLSLQEGMG